LGLGGVPQNTKGKRGGNKKKVRAYSGVKKPRRVDLTDNKRLMGMVFYFVESPMAVPESQAAKEWGGRKDRVGTVSFLVYQKFDRSENHRIRKGARRRLGVFFWVVLKKRAGVHPEEKERRLVCFGWTQKRERGETNERGKNTI